MRSFRKFSWLLIIIVITNCGEHYEENIDPCYNPYPQPTETNIVTFTKTNGDTLQHFNFENIEEPSYSTGNRTYHYEKTLIKIRYNTYYENDPEFYTVTPLYNGATSFEISITLVDSALSNNYEIYGLNINFMNGYYSYYESIHDSNTKITISKYGEVWEKIEGSFRSTFINDKNDLDSLNIDCQFSAVRWCDY